MTSRRRLKKEIDYVVSDLVLDCFTFINLYQKSNDEETLQIVQNTLAMRNDLRNKANHPERKEANGTVKSYYDNIAKTLLDNVEEGYSKLGTLLKTEK
jgi:hypothetical protein